MKKFNDVDDESDFFMLLNLSKGAESRKRILSTLLSGSKNCCQIARELQLNWRTVNRHLLILLKANLIRRIVFGQRIFFKLTPKGEEAIRFFQQTVKDNQQMMMQETQAEESDHEAI